MIRFEGMNHSFSHCCVVCDGGQCRILIPIHLIYFQIFHLRQIGLTMILLEVHNRIIEELLTLQIEAFLRKEKLVELKTDVVGK